MNQFRYVPLTKTVLSPGKDGFPPSNATVRIHITQQITNGKVLSDSKDNHPTGHEIDLTSSKVLSSLLDEIGGMQQGEVSQFLCKHTDMDKGLFPVSLPKNNDLIMEVELLSWRGQDISEEKDKTLLKSIIEDGTSSSRPCWTGKCAVELREGESAKQEILFRLGDGDTYGIPHSVELCVVTMSRQEQCLLTSTHNSSYYITLLSFEKERVLYKMGEVELAEGAQQLKDRGNAAVRAGKWRLAQLYYERAIEYLESGGKDKELHFACQLNLAHTLLKQEMFSLALATCHAVLWKKATSVKGLYRRALAHKGLGAYEEALVDVKKLLDLEPGNREGSALLVQLKQAKGTQVRSERTHMERTFAAVATKLEEEAAAAEPAVSIWEEATEHCPEELATEEAYEVYKTELDEQEKIRKEEDVAAQAAWDLANPCKKKKKRKKKKKAAPSEVEVVEVEDIAVDVPETIQEKEVDEGMEYHVAQEKTFINKTEDTPPLANVVTTGTGVVTTDTQPSADTPPLVDGVHEETRPVLANKEASDGIETISNKLKGCTVSEKAGLGSNESEAGADLNSDNTVNGGKENCNDRANVVVVETGS